MFQGLFNLLDFYLKEITLFYNKIDTYFREKIINILETRIASKDDINKIISEISIKLKGELIALGFESEKFEAWLFRETSSYKKDLMINDSLVSFYENWFLPVINEIFLELLLDHLAEINAKDISSNLKAKGLLPIEFILELQNFKSQLIKSSEHFQNFKKYIDVPNKIRKIFLENKQKIESLEDIQDLKSKLQLTYVVYRIIEMFHLQNNYDFSKIKEYIKNNSNEWLVSFPLISLKNPDPFFCAIFLSKSLNISIDLDSIKKFLFDIIDEACDEFESPLMEDTYKIYNIIKSLALLELKLSDEQLKKIIKTDAENFLPKNLMNLETSQLVIILKIFYMLGIAQKVDPQKIQAIINEIETRLSSDGIKLSRNGFISSEATYYVVFCGHMRSSLDKLKDYALLDQIISKIYRNIELINFSKDTNFDLLSELFYSFETLKLINCIESPDMIKNLIKYILPSDIVEKIMKSGNIFKENNKNFRHFKIDKITGSAINA